MDQHPAPPPSEAKPRLRYPGSATFTINKLCEIWHPPGFILLSQKPPLLKYWTSQSHNFSGVVPGGVGGI